MEREPRAFAYMRRQDKALARRVARKFAMPVADLFSSTRGSPNAAVARQALMYVFYYNRNYTFTKIGAILGRYRKTVAHGVEKTTERMAESDHFWQKMKASDFLS